SAANRDNEAAFESIRAALFTEKNTLRVVKAGQKTLDRRYTPPGAARFLELHARLGERAAACAEGRLAEAIAAFNDSAYAVFAGFLAHVEAWQRARRQMDFDDAEWQVLRLLRAPETAAFVQARLDARYKHVLLDEFQDTNPLQWRILRAWFDAYSDDERPRVFLVGDPKQSIYRFRRAEPRLFTVAAEFLEREFGAAYSAQNATRRNAPAIVEVVNALFADEPEFLPAPQTSLAAGLPGRVELLPLFARKAAQKSAAGEGLRDPLTEPDVEPEDSRRDDEACALAQKIAEIAGRDGPAWRIEADGGRPAKYGDIMLLARSRTHLSCVERALAAENIPFDAASRGGLLDALEARDVVALLEFLAAPLDGLKLAQALRSPIFACGDADLLTLAGAVAESGRSGGAAWWPALAELAAAGRAGPRLARAARLLSEWRLAAARLPAHDLIDRIYHEGEVLARYRRAAPPAAAPGVEANLRALPLLALELDGGRYPSLPRFIGHLRDLRAAEANDAPGEGRIESGGGAGRVRILTIHGAKGLEAPIVWLLGANEPPRREEPWDALIDWPAEADAPRHFSFVGLRAARGAARQKYFDEEAARARREESNLLYVALTRARQVFIASGIDDKRNTKADTPYRRLEAALERLGRLGVHGDELPTIAPPAADESSAKKTPGAPAPLPAVGEIRPEAEAGERFGVLLHALLERRTQGSESENWWKPLGFTDAEYARARPAADRLLAAPHLRRFFDPAQYLRARNEAEIAIDGRVRRIDRLVEFADEIWVLDYKSSTPDTPRLPEYQSQLAAYRRAAAATTPKPVHAALLFSGGELVELNGDGLTTESTEGTEKGKNKNL
ncbi:MAG: UvrD-helicase domain-containing protein, partial [Candidatus Accumulibacter sp.]|nr:UvrD-helicase domain-containing protein [Accumulibacter sp.]